MRGKPPLSEDLLKSETAGMNGVVQQCSHESLEVSLLLAMRQHILSVNWGTQKGALLRKMWIPQGSCTNIHRFEMHRCLQFHLRTSGYPADDVMIVRQPLRGCSIAL